MSAQEGPDLHRNDSGVHFSLTDGRIVSIDEPKQLQADAIVTSWVGSHVWESAVRLSRYLDHFSSTNNSVLAGKTLCEVGAGTGLVGIVAASLGAEVTLTDLQNAIPFLEHNVQLNKLLFRHIPSAQVLVWKSSEIYAEQQQPSPNQTYDYIVGAECIYVGSMIRPLLCTIRSLCHSDTIVVFSGIIGQHLVDEFLDKAEALFSIRALDWNDPTKSKPLSEDRAVYELRPIYVRTN